MSHRMTEDDLTALTEQAEGPPGATIEISKRELRWLLTEIRRARAAEERLTARVAELERALKEERDA